MSTSDIFQERMEHSFIVNGKQREIILKKKIILPKIETLLMIFQSDTVNVFTRWAICIGIDDVSQGQAKVTAATVTRQL